LPRRTLRKATRWTIEEWSQIEQAASVRGVTPLRYVREAALNSAAGAGGAGVSVGSSRGRAPASRRAHTLVNQLARVLNNLRQLHRVAEIDGNEGAAGLLAATASFVEDAISAVPGRLGAHAAEAVEGLLEAGVALNALAHRANTAEEVPPASELHAILDQVHSAVHNAVH
jgi:hypothetical protein